jgi:hypothetical protein
MERSISRSGDLSLSYLTSLGIQSFAQYAGVTGGKPALVFDVSHSCVCVFYVLLTVHLDYLCN